MAATTDELRAHLAELEIKFHESAGSGAAALSRAMMLVRERIDAEAKASKPSEIDELQGRLGLSSSRKGAGSPRKTSGKPRRSQA